MDESYNSYLKQVRISVCGERCKMMIGKAILRLFDCPSYVCFRVNKEWNSIIVLPCESKEMLSFRVPDHIFGKNGREFIITSKSFVRELIRKNKLEMEKNYMIPGKYVENEKCVVFQMSDAFEHMFSTDDDLSEE